MTLAASGNAASLCSISSANSPKPLLASPVSSSLVVLISPLVLAPTLPRSISVNISDTFWYPDKRIASPMPLKKSTILLNMPCDLGGIFTRSSLALNISAIASSTKNSSLFSSVSSLPSNVAELILTLL